MNKKKVINDPVYGFITIPHDLVFDVLEHPFFQRLRRIKQLGLTHLVYPGAMHTRFSHALGAMFLMRQAIAVLREKGNEISEKEALGAIIAILLHDIGHGPFSHALESSIIHGVSHEDLSKLLIQKMNKDFDGKLNTAIEIFENRHPKKFLHQLVSSQLDVDRLDYLNRDTYFSGVSEGVVGWDRIIKMLHVADGNLVVEEKGFYSIEKFLIARRIMYWQVYLHKTAMAAESMLLKILKRAQYLAQNGKELFATPALQFFIKNNIQRNVFLQDEKAISNFIAIDDFDILTSIKVWCNSKDKILSLLCKKLINRDLHKGIVQNEKFNPSFLEKIKAEIQRNFQVEESEIMYFMDEGSVSNHTYNKESSQILILRKNGNLMDLAQFAKELNINALSNTKEKYFVIYPQEIQSLI